MSFHIGRSIRILLFLTFFLQIFTKHFSCLFIYRCSRIIHRSFSFYCDFFSILKIRALRKEGRESVEKNLIKSLNEWHWKRPESEKKNGRLKFILKHFSREKIAEFLFRACSFSIYFIISFFFHLIFCNKLKWAFKSIILSSVSIFRINKIHSLLRI